MDPLKLRELTDKGKGQSGGQAPTGTLEPSFGQTSYGRPATGKGRRLFPMKSHAKPLQEPIDEDGSLEEHTVAKPQPPSTCMRP